MIYKNFPLCLPTAWIIFRVFAEMRINQQHGKTVKAAEFHS